MKNFIGIITIMVLFLSTPTLGQTTFAIRSGVTMTKLNGDVGLFSQARKGIKIGASVTIPIQRRLGLQISGDYVQKGRNTLSFYEDEKTHIDYIEFSGLANFMGQVQKVL